MTRPRRGRPRKFASPSRAVTLTLPEHIIAALEAVDRDISRAVVRVAQPRVGTRRLPAAELAAFGRHAVIVVKPTRTLEQRTGVTLVPLSDGRALISFDDSMTTARLELLIEDALDNHDLVTEDARTFKDIRDLLRKARRSKSVAIRQQNIIVLEYLGNDRRRLASMRNRKETR